VEELDNLTEIGVIGGAICLWRLEKTLGGIMLEANPRSVEDFSFLLVSVTYLERNPT
jgi:hypothetical protein